MRIPMLERSSLSAASAAAQTPPRHAALALAAAKLGLSRYILYALAASLAADGILAAALLFKKPVVQTILIPSPVFDPVPAAWTYDEAGPSQELLSLLAQKLIGWRTNLHAGTGPDAVAGFLQHVAPEAAADFRAAFEEELQALARDDAASAFFIESTAVDRRTLTAVVKGRQKTFIGAKIVADGPKAYRLAFEYRAGRILLTSVEAVPADERRS